MTKKENLIGNSISWDGLRQHEQFKLGPLTSFSFESHTPPMIPKEAKEKTLHWLFFNIKHTSTLLPQFLRYICMCDIC